MAEHRGGGGGAALVAVCPAITRKGTRCTQSVEGAHSTYCHHHDPARARERVLNASRAGRSRPPRELAAVKALLQDLTDQVVSGELPAYRAAVAAQLLNTRLRAIELERKIQETDELIERLDALERNRGVGGGATRWGG
jgi:hypothetical protein